MSEFTDKFKKFCELKCNYYSIKDENRAKAMETISQLTKQEVRDYLLLTEYYGDDLKVDLLTLAVQKMISNP